MFQYNNKKSYVDCLKNITNLNYILYILAEF